MPALWYLNRINNAGVYVVSRMPKHCFLGRSPGLMCVAGMVSVRPYLSTYSIPKLSKRAATAAGMAAPPSHIQFSSRLTWKIILWQR
jgi:hypothetical protein